jgi:hypothetical protein
VGYAAATDAVQLEAVDAKTQLPQKVPSAAAADGTRQQAVPPSVETTSQDEASAPAADGGGTAAGKPISDVVPLAMGDGTLAIGGFEELLMAPSPSPPPAQADAGVEQEAPNAPVSTEVLPEAQEETAAAVAAEMNHKQ